MAAASSPAQLTESTVPTPAAGVSAIAVSASKDIWFLETFANKIGRITPAGVLSEFALPGSPGNPAGATDVAVGPDGNIWITAIYFSEILRMTPAGVFTEFPLGGTESKEPRGIAAGPGGLWFTEEVGNKIGRITTDGVVTEFDIPAGYAGLAGIAAGPDGNVWFTEIVRDRIGRITPEGVVTEFQLSASRGLGPIVAGPDGNLWFTEAIADKVGRITPEGVLTEFQLAPGSRPFGIAAGVDGNLWIVLNSDQGLARMTPSGEFTTALQLSDFESFPYAIAASPDGSLWFTESKGNRIGHFDTGLRPLCTPSATKLCLASNRFEVTVTWSIPSGTTGSGQAISLTSDTGYFWFFAASNVELVLKILDGRSLTGAWWVFYGALSDVNYTIRVEDTQTRQVKTYQNPQGKLASVADTGAIPGVAPAAFSLATGKAATAAELSSLTALAAGQGFSLAPAVLAQPRETTSTDGPGAASPPASSKASAGPVGSTYEIETLLAEDADGDGVGKLFRICAGAGDFAVTFDGSAETLPPYTCRDNTTPQATETFTDHGNGTATVELRVASTNGLDLFPAGLFGDGVALDGAAVRIGFFQGSDPLDWTPAHKVLAATLDFRVNGLSVFPGGFSQLDPNLFFGGPGAWTGNLGVFFANRAGTGIDEVVLRLTVEQPVASAACVPDATHLCLQNDRFRVSVRWQTATGASGVGQAVELTADTGYFWFFSSTNVELVLKVIDGRSLTGFWWVFYGALSDVNYIITVEDTVSGLSKEYSNPQGKLASVADTAALP